MIKVEYGILIMPEQGTAKYPPQSYTQKLLDLGIIEFQENNIDEETDGYQWIVYQVLPDFTVLYFNEYGMEVPCLVGNIAERYWKNLYGSFTFESFEVYPYIDIETEDVLYPEVEITVYKKMEVSLD